VETAYPRGMRSRKTPGGTRLKRPHFSAPSMVLVSALVGVLIPVSGLADSPEDCSLAADLLGETAINVSQQHGEDAQVEVLGALGNWKPLAGPDVCALSNWVRSGATVDGYDEPVRTAERARVEQTWTLNPPAGSQSLAVRAAFFSDPMQTANPMPAQVWLRAAAAGEETPLFVDAFGNGVFGQQDDTETSSLAALIGTGFEGGWSSGWYMAVGSVVGTSEVTIRVVVPNETTSVREPSFWTRSSGQRRPPRTGRPQHESALQVRLKPPPGGLRMIRRRSTLSCRGEGEQRREPPCSSAEGQWEASPPFRSVLSRSRSRPLTRVASSSKASRRLTKLARLRGRMCPSG